MAPHIIGAIMSQQLYKVVEASWKGGIRVESDIGCEWKPEDKARSEMNRLQRDKPSRLYSLQKQGKK